MSLCSTFCFPLPLFWLSRSRPLTPELAWRSSPAWHRGKHCMILALIYKLARQGACHTVQFMSPCSVPWVRPPSLRRLYYRFLKNLKTFHWWDLLSHHPVLFLHQTNLQLCIYFRLFVQCLYPSVHYESYQRRGGCVLLSILLPVLPSTMLGTWRAPVNICWMHIWVSEWKLNPGPTVFLLS